MFAPRRRSWFAAGCLGLVFASLAGCASTPEPRPLRPPEVDIKLSYYLGSPLTGPTPTPAGGLQVSRDPSDALAVSCDLLYLERTPGAVLDPLSTKSRLVLAARSGDPFLPAATLVPGARVGVVNRVEDLIANAESTVGGRLQCLSSLTGALPAGVTAVFDATSKKSVTGVGVAARRDVEVHVGRTGDERLTLVLGVTGVIMEHSDPGLLVEEQRGQKPVEVVSREYIVLDRAPEIGGAPLGLVVPSPFVGDEGSAVAAIVRIERAPRTGQARAEHSGALARCLADVRQSARRSAEEAVPVPAAELTADKLKSAFAALSSADHRRSALVLVASATNAELAADLALIADDELLTRYVAAIEKRSKADKGGTDAKQRLGWLLEQTAFRTLGEMLADEELPPDLLAILVRHGGAVGALAGELEEAIARVKDLAAFEQYLVAQNRAFLEHRHPAIRARAYDWLARRGLAPANYDPVGSDAERRRALEQDRISRGQR